MVFRARCYRELGQLDRSLSDYERVYSSNTSTPFATVALQEAGEIEFERGNFSESLGLYQQLGGLASKLQNRVIAWFGIAKNQKELGRYREAKDKLALIANNPEVEVYSRTEAKVEMGRCEYLDGDLIGAFQTFSEVESDFKNAFGAESQAMKAQILLDQGLDLKRRGRTTEATAKFEEVKDATRYMANNYPTF